MNSLSDWFEKWLLKLNINKCKVVSFGRNVINVHQYSIGSSELEHVYHINDLGIIFEDKLNFSLHISAKVIKANSILGIIKRNFRYLSQQSFVMLYKALVRSHLEYAIAVWCPYKKGDISSLEKVQRRATKFIDSIKHLPYVDILIQLKLPTFKYRRARGDMIEVYKILQGFYDNTSNITLTPHVGIATRGNKYKLYQSFVEYDLKSFFLLIEWRRYGIVYRMKLWILTLLIVLKVDLINKGVINLSIITGMPTSLELGIKVYVIEKVY